MRHHGLVLFVDDNSSATARPRSICCQHLIDWQKRTGYVLRFCLRATLTLPAPENPVADARSLTSQHLLRHRDADPAALKAMKRSQHDGSIMERLRRS